MPERAIVEHPDDTLREVSKEVESFGGELEALVDDLHATRRAHGALGLAAPQIGERQRVIVCAANDSPEESKTYINPTVTASSRWAYVEETCLSVPGRTGLVERPTQLSVVARDLRGERFTQELEGLEAVCLHHELDHLDGVLFIDRVTAWAQFQLRIVQGVRRLIGKQQGANY